MIVISIVRCDDAEQMLSLSFSAANIVIYATGRRAVFTFAALNGTTNLFAVYNEYTARFITHCITIY